MKMLKKLLAVALALTLALGTCMTAMADTVVTSTDNQNNGQITIKKAARGNSYSIYKMFDVTYSYTSDGTTQSSGTYSYKVTDDWKNFFAQGSEGAKYITVDDDGYVTDYSALMEESTDAEGNTVEVVNDGKTALLATAALNWAQKNGVGATGTVNGETTKTNTTDENANPTITEYNGEVKEGENAGDYCNITWSHLELGYYLIGTSLGTAGMLDTTNPRFEVNEKNNLPNVKKQMQEGTEWRSLNDASVGDTVNFRVCIEVDQNASHAYTLHDVMESGLKLDTSSVRVYKQASTDTGELNPDNTGTLTGRSDSVTTEWSSEEPTGYVYEFKSPGTETDDGVTVCTFEIDIVQAYINSLNSGDKIWIYYSATVTEDAIAQTQKTDSSDTTDAGVQNDTWVQYTDTNNTTHSTTTTYTWNIPVYKYTNPTDENADGTALAGAKFALYYEATENESTVRYYRTKTTNSSTTPATVTYGWTKVAAKADGTFTIPTNAEYGTSAATTGTLTFQGLDSGTYYLEETEAPDGYNMLANPVRIEIEATTETTEMTSSLTGAVKNANDVNYGEATPAATLTNSTDSTLYVKVQNNTGTELPGTGGIGTTIFYVVGGILAAGALVLLIARRRVDSEA